MSDHHREQFTRRTVIKGAVAAGASLAAGGGLAGCASTGFAQAARTGAERDAHDLLRDYDGEGKRLYTAYNEAQWIASTDVSEEHTKAAAAARNRFDEFIGRPERMERIAALRARAWACPPIVSRQLEKAWMLAAHAPGSIPDLVRQRAEAEAKQSQVQDGFEFTLYVAGASPKKVTANDLDEILQKSTIVDERLAAWTASKQIGAPLRPGLVELQRLRNAVARELKFSSFFGLEVADYGMSVRELMELGRTVLAQMRPFYEQLHCYAKHVLAKRYGQRVPRRIPAHWLPNRWGQEWPGLEEAADLDPLFAGKTKEWIVEQSERFYVSMGFPRLPAGFWKKSDLYELPSDATRKKNRHASAWHIDLEQDVRSLMSIKPNAQWFTTAHHELGHIYYFLSYATRRVPLLLREGANRAFHEAIGELISLASTQRPYLAEIGLLAADAKTDPMRWLLAQAMGGSNIVFQPWSWGVMTGFEHDLYEADLPTDRFNARWWALAAEHQGIDPPAARGEEFCDAATKTHINDDPAGYYDYALCSLIVYQVHDYIARKILKQDPHACNYYNRQDVGEYLHAMLSLGATRDWRQVLRDFTGEDLSARAMLEYYAPLMNFLKEQNAGRDVGFA